MANTQYALHLKGFVGGADFDRNYVDYVLAQHVGKPVNVLIDSLGGSVATALSIASAFRNHADVSVHFVGMNASAATIASLGEIGRAHGLNSSHSRKSRMPSSA